MTDVSPLIDAMGLAPHPEGGHYRRTWTAPARVDTPRGSRHSASAIMFLLECDEEARWHLAAHLRPRRLRVGLISARPKH